MNIMDILVRDAVLIELASDTKNDVLAEMAEALAAAVPSLDAARLLRVLADREGLLSTGIGEGVALPHGKIPDLDRPVASFARSATGIDFDSRDGLPTHLFFLLVVPDGSHYTKTLPRISRFFLNAEFREKLSVANRPEEVFQAFEDADGKIDDAGP